jgi:AcrR family transcriptional regulator
MSSTRAETTHQKILDAANRLLLERGYHGVGLEEVAQAAGYTRQTVYDRFGSKAGLLTAMVTRAEELAGLPTKLPRVWAQATGIRMLRAFLDTLAEVEPQVFPYSRLVHAARLEDPTASQLWDWRMASRHAGLRMVMGRLAAEGRLAEGVTIDEAAEVASALTSPQQYEILVIEHGWSIERYRAHLERTITARLLRTAPRKRASASLEDTPEGDPE